jgi:asparagine synthase (glutamine-hydrolysing)
MCGIAGYFGKNEIPDVRVDACLKLMHHRGPDARGVFRSSSAREGNVLLLHTRLQIIDQDPRANQPFEDEDLAFITNGELYNFLELKEEALRKGEVFRTRSDTEVFFKILKREGLKGLERCEGIWAFALYQKQTKTLNLSRDRFGEKPLYLLRDDSGLYFGSEIKFLSALLGKKLEINLQQLYRFLVNGYRSLNKRNETFFQGVEKLNPGESLTVSFDRKEKIETFWNPTQTAKEDMTYDEAVNGARSALIRAVELRLRSDVPLAFQLSGGVDSNALASIAKRVFGYDVHGFTIATNDSRYDESALVRSIVHETGIRHTVLRPENIEFLPAMKTLVKAHDSPVATITYFAQWLLAGEIAKSGYKVAISGTGADEIFSGYYDHHLYYLREIRKEKTYRASLDYWKKYIYPLVRNPYLSDPDLFIENPEIRDHLYLNSEEFSSYLHTPWSEPFEENHFRKDLLRNRMMNEMFYEVVPVILQEEDLNTMYFGVENRSPFLDRQLYEFCLGIPTRHLIRKGYAKSILRDAVQDLVPEKVTGNHQKVGFNLSIQSVLDLKVPSVRAALLDGSPIFEYVRRDKIEEVLAKDSLPNSFSKFLFNFIGSKIFLEEFT